MTSHSTSTTTTVSTTNEEEVHLFTTGFMNNYQDEKENSNGSTYTWGAFQSEYLTRLNKNNSNNNGFSIRNNPYSMLISKPLFEIVTTTTTTTTTKNNNHSTSGGNNTASSLLSNVGHNEISTLVAASPKSPLSRVALDLLSSSTTVSTASTTVEDDAILPSTVLFDSHNNRNSNSNGENTDTESSVLSSSSSSSSEATYLGSRLQSSHFRTIAASGQNILLLHSSGDIYQWTLPTLIRQHQQQQQNLPHLIQSLTWERVLRNFTINAIACGPNHCLALTSAPYFDVYSWGNGENGRLGHGSTNTGTTNNHNMVVRHETNPRLVSALIPYRVTSIAAGTAHSAAITMGSVGLYLIEQTELEYLSGNKDDASNLNNSSSTENSSNNNSSTNTVTSSPTQPIPLNSVSPSVQQQLAINILNRNKHQYKVNNHNHDQNLGNVWTWGKGTDGALGHGTNDDIHEPKRVHGIVRIHHRILTMTNNSGMMNRELSMTSLNNYNGSVRDDLSETSSVDTGVYPDSARRNTVTNANRIRLGGNPSAGGGTNGKNGVPNGGTVPDTYETYRIGLPTMSGNNMNSSSFHYPLRRNVTANSANDPITKPNPSLQRNERAIVVSLSCGNQITGVITADGDVWVWGRGKEGQMGVDLKQLGKMANSTVTNGVTPSVMENNLLRPHRVVFPPMQYHLDTDSVCRAATKIYHKMDPFTRLLACPWTLQTSAENKQATPAAKDTEETEPVEELTTPQLTSFVTKSLEEGMKKVWTMDPFYWATGNERITVDSTPSVYYENLSIPDTLKAATIAAGESHFVIGGRDGSVWSWGLNIDGQVGMGRLNSEIHRPTQLPVHLYAQAHAESFAIAHHQDPNLLMLSAGSDPVVSVHAGAFHTVVVCCSGLLMTWGRNNNHQLGVENQAPACQPEAVQLNNATSKLQAAITGKEFSFGTNGMNVLAVACGNDFTSVLGNFSASTDKVTPSIPIHHTTSAQTLSSTNTDNIEEEPTLAPPQESKTSEDEKNFALKTPRKKNSISGISRTSSLSSTGSQNVASFEDVIRSPNLRRGLSMAYGGNNNRNLKIQRPSSLRIPGTSTVSSAISILSEAVMANLLRTAELKSSRRLVDEMRKQGLVDEWNTALQTMSGNWNAFMMTDVRLQNLWRQGLPPQLRCYVWPLAVGNSLKITPAIFDMCRIKAATVISHLQSTSSSNTARDPEITTSSSSESENYTPHGKFDSRLSEPNNQTPKFSLVGRESSIGLINMDLLRTFSHLELFGPPDSHSAGPFYECVLDVLQAFCCLRPELGYVQGMSYIAAIIALHVAGTAVWATRNSNESISVGQRSAPSSSSKDNLTLPVSPTPMKRYRATVGAYGGVLSSPLGSPMAGMSTPYPTGFPPVNTPYSRSLSALSPVVPSQMSGWKITASLLPVLPVSPGILSPDAKSLQSLSFTSPSTTVKRLPNLVSSPSLIETSQSDSAERTPVVNRHRTQDSTGQRQRSTVTKLSSNLVVGDATFLTFQIFANLLCRHHLYVFYTMDAAALTPYCTLFETLMDLRQPEVYRKLDSSGIRTEMYLFGWFQTLFLKSLPLAVAVRVWDVFLLDGVVHLYRTALAIIDLLSSHILAPTAGFEEVVNLLTQGRTATAVWAMITDPDVLFRAIDNVIIPNELVIQIEDLCNDPFFYRFVAER